MQKIILASGNQGKLNEMQQLLSDLPFEITPQSEFSVSDADETGLTFVENAIIKARHACAETGLPAIADDSGIEVDALNGAPGIYSARYAGLRRNDSSNIEKLLSDLQGLPAEKRGACFQCVIVYMQHANDPTPIICQGTWRGQITTEIVGEGGFGYDPIFYLPERDCTSSQLSPQDKNKLSHRGQALTQLHKKLQ